MGRFHRAICVSGLPTLNSKLTARPKGTPSMATLFKHSIINNKSRGTDASALIETAKEMCYWSASRIQTVTLWPVRCLKAWLKVL